MKKVVVLSGCSGSGKSTYIRQLCAREPELAEYAAIVSADHYFLRDGVYTFDGSKIGEAHAQCFRVFIDLLNVGRKLVFVDNTNTTVEEIAPYMLGAAAFGYEAEIVTIVPTLESDLEMLAKGAVKTVSAYAAKLAERNVHGVSVESIGAQWDRIARRQLPPWWASSDVVMDEVSVETPGMNVRNLGCLEGMFDDLPSRATSPERPEVLRHRGGGRP